MRQPFGVGRGITPADELFVSLDGTTLHVGNDCWRIEIYGIHTFGAQNWLQLTLTATRRWMVTIHTRQLRASDIHARLVEWLLGDGTPLSDCGLETVHA
jgi:hypothetical protein